MLKLRYGCRAPAVESEGNFLHKMLCVGIDPRPRSYISAFTRNRDREGVAF